MTRSRPVRLSVSLAVALLATPAVRAAEPTRVDAAFLSRLRDEGLNRGRSHETIRLLCDEIGPRLTGSPSYRKAALATRDALAAQGLVNARLAPFSFGRGWELENVSVTLEVPHAMPIAAIPKAWTPGTGGPKTAEAVRVTLANEKDLEAQKGKLAGKIVLLADPVEKKPAADVDFDTYTDEELAKLSGFEIEAGGPPRDREGFAARRAFQQKLRPFLVEEKVVATLEPSRGFDGTIFAGGGGSWTPSDPEGVPGLVIATEDYNRLARLLARKKPVKLTVNVAARFVPPAAENAANVLAEIPGSGRADEIVMLGAHLDSWQAATGATDNAAGVAVAMEAVRLLKAVGFVPKRTIRIGLWGGEEQGLLGSRAYAAEELAARPEPTDPAEKELPPFARRSTGPLTLKPGHAKHAVYFNLDNGAGRVRGIWAENNVAAAELFRAWLEPFEDLGVTTVTLRRTGGTDHQSFDGVGVPGFQLLQDQLDYDSRTHHSNMDVPERIPPGNLDQASVVMAALVAHAAQLEGTFPRKPMPKDPPAPPAAPPAAAPGVPPLAPAPPAKPSPAEVTK
ncbi:MAG: M20/M25/M40 family metallo-hydrolase [Acidobacteria bacterium]|nr:M20/M25/M40 family metallo-hydrolase [Acidobacteriota bacterium]